MSLEAIIDQRRWEKYFPASATTECAAQMRETATSIPGLHCMVLSSLDGMPLAHIAGREINTTRLAAIIGSLCGLGETLAKELEQADFRDVMISTNHGIAVVQRVPAPGDRMVLMTATSHETNIGIVSTQSRWCAQTLGQRAFKLGVNM